MGPGVMFRRLVRPAYQRTRALILRHAFERRAGIDTEGRVDLAELGLDAEGRVYYGPSGWLSLRRALRGVAIGEDDVFLDLGSGKGRVVYLAAAGYPFKRVIGVELSEELNAVARANIERVRDRLRCRDVELITADVLEYEIPDDVTIVYMFNPFTGPIFEHVVRELVASLDRRPRDLLVVYAVPEEEKTLLASGRARRVRHVRGWRPTRQWSHWNSVSVYAMR